MINNTNQPVILASDDDLDQQIRASLAYVAQYLIGRHAPVTTPEAKDQGPLSLHHFLGLHVLGAAKLDEAFILAAYAFSQTEARHVGAKEHIEKLVSYAQGGKQPAVHKYGGLKMGLKLLLVHLWSKRVILLPLCFLVGNTLASNRDFFAAVETPVITFFRSYAAGNPQRPVHANPLSEASNFVLAQHAPRIIWASDWHEFAGISIAEMGDLHRAYNQARAGLSGILMPSTPFPFQLMLAELLLCHPEVGFTQDDIDLYSQWLLERARSTTGYSYQEYVSNLSRILVDREREKEALRAAQRAKERGVKRGPRPSPRDSKGMLETIITGTTADPDLNHAAIINCFGKLTGVRRGGLSWLELQAPYPGREHVDLPKLSRLWKKAANSWLEARKKKGYDKTDGQLAALNILFDYLFLYLPWWKELYPQAKLELPMAPKNFLRGLFVDQTILDDARAGEDADNPAYQLPKTLLEMIAVRQSKPGAQYATIVQLDQFFKHVQKKFQKDELMAGRDFDNPVDREWDLPRQSRAGKTNKIPFSKHTYPHLLFYAYAVEAFGLYLQQRAIEEDFFASKSSRNAPVFNTAKYGYIPVIFYHRRCYPVFEVTNVYSIARRTIDTASRMAEVLHLAPSSGTKDVWIPNLAVLRMFIGAIEMGLRLQSLQWLDRGTWDSLNPEPPDLMFSMEGPLSGEYAYKLLVPTDKTKDHAWVTRFTYRLREVFYREQLFQEAIREPDMDKRVDYEYIVNNRFGQIWPLFRSNATAAPYCDQTYARSWRAFMAGFQFYLNTKTSHPTQEKRFAFPPADQFVALLALVPKLDDDGKPIVENNYCPLRIALVHTPHSCRSTFASIRQGLLENSIIEALLGHVIGGRSTTHYQVALPEDLEAGLERSDRANLQTALYPFDKKAHIRADRQDSAFVKAIHADRAAAVHDFGLISGVVHWSLDELDGMNEKKDEGVRLFLDSPLGQIVARETHVCPVGEQCPIEVVKKIGGFKRCGLCPIAVVGVDHLDAISAKRDELREVIEFEFRRITRLQRSNSEPESVLEALWDNLDVIGLEWAGWKLLEEILLKKLELMRNDKEPFTYHSGAPEIVRRLVCVTIKDVNQREAMLKRLDGAYSFPSMENEITLFQATQLRADLYTALRLMEEGMADGFSEPFVSAALGNELTQLAYDIKNYVEPRGYRIEDVLGRLEQIRQSPPQRLEQNQDNRFLISTEAIEAEIVIQASSNGSFPDRNAGQTGDQE